MARLVFRPFTQVSRTICTSVSLGPSTRVSSGFSRLGQSSPSFGSQRPRSHSNPSSENRGRSVVPRSHRGAGSHLSAQRRLHLHYALGFATRVLAWTVDSLVRVTRRVDGSQFARIQSTQTDPEVLAEARALRSAGLPSVPHAVSTPIGYNRAANAPTFRSVFSRARNRSWPPPRRSTTARPFVQGRPREPPRGHHWFQSLPFQQFQVLLALFSKCFSSFAHATCSLSVSRRYRSFRWHLPPT